MRFCLMIVLTVLAGCAARPAPAPSQPASAEVPADINWQQAERIDIGLSSFEFTPATIVLRKGRPYRLHLQNNSDGGHNFKAPEFFASATLRPDSAPDKNGTVELAGGEATDIYLVPAKAGTFELVCSHFMHAPLGMNGKIIVQ